MGRECRTRSPSSRPLDGLRFRTRTSPSPCSAARRTSGTPCCRRRSWSQRMHCAAAPREGSGSRRCRIWARVPVKSSPDTTTAPARRRLWPARTSTSSSWPLPAMAAMPTISPARTDRSTPRSEGTPASSSASTPEIRKRMSPAVDGGALGASLGTAPPIISSAMAWVVSSPTRPRPTARPRRRTVTSSAYLVTSRNLCVMRMMLISRARAMPWSIARTSSASPLA